MTAPPKSPPAAPPKAPPRVAAPAAPTTASASEPAAIGPVKPEFRPPRIVLNGVEGWGKTTLAAYAPKSVILEAPGETGYETLYGVGLVPEVAVGQVSSWPQLLATLDSLAGSDYEVVALDALGGFEHLCHEYVCATEYNGVWGEKGFASYQKGYDLSAGEWLQLLTRLDRLQADGKTTLLLAHCKVATFKNPSDADYDRWVADVHKLTWSVTHKWADAVFFGNFFSVIEGGRTGEKPRKGKGIGGTERVLYTERRDAWDAKNRYGMPEVVDIPNDPSKTWGAVWNAIRKGAK